LARRKSSARRGGDGRDKQGGSKPAAKARSGTATRKAARAREEAGTIRLVVGLGASAGGLDAYKAFFAHMPPQSGMAFVLVQHLDPQHKSLLAELLSRHTEMRVTTAENGAAVAADHVYVIPPDSTLTIHDGILRLATPAPPRESRRPIDAFFSSLAEDQGEKAVSIILAGSGSDGTLGLRAVKEHGGLTLAQAGFDETALLGMPSSAAATGLVDYVMPVEEMPERLIAYARHLGKVVGQKGTDGTRRDAQEHLIKICALLRARLGHDFSDYKDKTLIRRIQRRMQVLQIDSVPKYIERLRKDPPELELLFRDLLIGVTQFFRDPDAFAALQETVLPRLLTSKGPDTPIRVWVPGCATGEEAYSIAILLKESMAQQEIVIPVQIFGTDLDEHSVTIARHGQYRKAPAEVSPERLERWFIEDGEGYSLRKEIREMCVFSAHNLVKDPPFSKLDLISCRNLMIYLNAGLQDRLAQTFHYALRPGGYLFLGTSESVSRHSRLFTVLDKKHRLFQRRDDVPAALPSFAMSGAVTASGEAAPPPPETGRTAIDRIDQHARRALERFSPAHLVVNKDNEVLHFSAQIGRYIEPSAGAASLNLSKILKRELQAAARTALQQARNTRQAVVQSGLIAAIEGANRVVDVVAIPLPEAGDELSVIAFQDHGPIGSDAAASAAEDGTISARTLEKELRATRAQLQTTIDELGTANEELKSSNEEYQSVNEELQSTNEELETSKEELTSINEELQTINAELSSKNEALSRANSDLKNLLDSTQIATLFLDHDLRIKTFTPAMSEIVPVRDSDRGRPITEIVTRILYDDLRRDVRKVLRDLAPIEREVTAQESGATYLMHIRPYRTIDDVIDGVVLTFVDITERKRHEEQSARLAAIVGSSLDAIIGSALDGTITTWNFGAERLFGHPASEAIGRSLSLVLPAERADEITALLDQVRRGERVEYYEIARQAADGTPIHLLLSFSPVKGEAGKVIGISIIAHDITERRRADEARMLMVDELNHRVKNTLATVQSIVAQSLKGVEPEKLATLDARLVALSRAHDLLTGSNWEGASLTELLLLELDPYRSERRRRLSLEGPEIRLAPKAAVALAMAFHELATNAAKYGALSNAKGRIRVAWAIEESASPPALCLTWTERDGPTVAPPQRRGLGSRVIERGLALELDGKVDLAFESAGLICTIRIPLPPSGGG